MLDICTGSFVAVESASTSSLERSSFSVPSVLSPIPSTSTVLFSVAEPPLFWEAPAPDGQGPGADSGAALKVAAPAAPAPQHWYYYLCWTFALAHWWRGGRICLHLVPRQVAAFLFPQFLSPLPSTGTSIIIK